MKRERERKIEVRGVTDRDERHKRQTDRQTDREREREREM